MPIFIQPWSCSSTEMQAVRKVDQLSRRLWETSIFKCFAKTCSFLCCINFLVQNLTPTRMHIVGNDIQREWITSDSSEWKRPGT